MAAQSVVFAVRLAVRREAKCGGFSASIVASAPNSLCAGLNFGRRRALCLCNKTKGHYCGRCQGAWGARCLSNEAAHLRPV